MIETFMAQYPATISAISAFATVSAVIAALYMAQRQFRPRLAIFADINAYISSESQNDLQDVKMESALLVICVKINNIGPV